MFKFENFLLGTNEEDILMESSEENIVAAETMVKQAVRTIYIVSPLLDPVIYDRPEFVEGVKKMVLRSNKARVNILVQDPGRIVKRGHQLVDLAFALSSFIEIRVPGKEHESLNDSLLVVDETGYIYRKSADRFEAKMNFNDMRASRLLIHEFEQIWEKSRTDPNLRRALI